MLKSLYSKTSAESVRIGNDINAIVNLSATLCNVSLANMHLLKNTDYYLGKPSNSQIHAQKIYSPFCKYLYDTNSSILVIPDVSKDARFNKLESVVNNAVHFYAGVRLEDTTGNTIGTLYVTDKEPKELNDRQQDGLILLGQQITNRLEEHKNTIMLNKLKNELQNKNEQLRNFAGVVSHDMKMPLANMILTCDLLRSKYKNIIDEEGSKYLYKMKQSALMLSEYITNILQHYESDRVAALESEEFYLHDLIENTIDLLNIQEECDINLPSKNFKISGNETALGQIFMNLLTNSLKYNDKEKIIIDIDCSKDNDYYHFSFRDNGVGIPKELLPDIFHLFKTFGQIDRKGNVGSGIGLSTVRKLIMSLGGDIEVDSKLGESTTFYFRIEHP